MPPHTVSKDLKARILTLYYRGYKPKEICDLLGVGKSLVYKTLQYHHIYGLAYNPHTQLTARRRILTPLYISFIRLHPSTSVSFVYSFRITIRYTLMNYNSNSKPNIMCLYLS